MCIQLGEIEPCLLLTRSFIDWISETPPQGYTHLQSSPLTGTLREQHHNIMT